MATVNSSITAALQQQVLVMMKRGIRIMEILETDRLILRPFEEDDFEAVHAYASVAENVQYMLWGPNEESDTIAFISYAVLKSKETPCHDYQYAVVLKSSRKLIGSCGLTISDGNEAELGWIFHKDYWKQGYGTEMGSRMIELGFSKLDLHRTVIRKTMDRTVSWNG